ncbi:MAG: hypothetical protein Q9218_004921 [Villophora microphyllina]
MDSLRPRRLFAKTDDGGIGERDEGTGRGHNGGSQGAGDSLAACRRHDDSAAGEAHTAIATSQEHEGQATLAIPNGDRSHDTTQHSDSNAQYQQAAIELANTTARQSHNEAAATLGNGIAFAPVLDSSMAQLVIEVQSGYHHGNVIRTGHNIPVPIQVTVVTAHFADGVSIAEYDDSAATVAQPPIHKEPTNANTTNTTTHIYDAQLNPATATSTNSSLA